MIFSDRDQPASRRLYTPGAQLSITPPVDGIYTVLIIPDTTLTGSLTMSLTNP